MASTSRLAQKVELIKTFQTSLRIHQKFQIDFKEDSFSIHEIFQRAFRSLHTSRKANIMTPKQIGKYALMLQVERSDCIFSQEHWQATVTKTHLTQWHKSKRTSSQEEILSLVNITKGIKLSKIQHLQNY